MSGISAYAHGMTGGVTHMSIELEIRVKSVRAGCIAICRSVHHDAHPETRLLRFVVVVICPNRGMLNRPPKLSVSRGAQDWNVMNYSSRDRAKLRNRCVQCSYFARLLCEY